MIGALGANHWSTDVINLAPTSLLSFIDILVQTRDGLAATAVSCRVHVCIIPGVHVLLIILTEISIVVIAIVTCMHACMYDI